MNETWSVRLPEAFAGKMKQLLGEEYETFLAGYEAECVQGLRLNPLKGGLQEMEQRYGALFGLKPVPWCREGFYYEGETRPGRHPCHEAGVYYIQEPSAMAVVSLLDPQPGERVLDLCAAPGGKTTQIAGRLQGRGLLVSNEIHPARARILSQNVERMGIVNAVVTNENSEKLRRCFPEFFDRIVVDAPCSGEGMFRKDQQARAEWSEANVELCAKRQQEILDNAAAMLRPGGRIVYSTCTFSPEEDEESVAAFLEGHGDFFLEKPEPLPGLSPGRPEWSRLECPELADTCRIWPHKSRGEGHYLALLRKQGNTQGVSLGEQGERSGDGRRKGKKAEPEFWNDKAGREALQRFARELFAPEWEEKLAREKRLVLFGEQLYRLPEGMPVLDGLKTLRPGIHLATRKKDRLEPAHALALALRPEQVRRFLNLESDSAQLRAYLSGQTLPLLDAASGWTLVCVDGYSLGWGKVTSGVLKNHYPKGLRIL